MSKIMQALKNRARWAKLHTPIVLSFALNLALLLLTGLIFHDGKKGEEPIYIGAILPFSTDHSSIGIHAAFGMHIPKSVINETGGVLGKKLDLIILNDKDMPELALKNYRHLRDDKNVVAIIGSPLANNAKIVKKEAEKDGMPFFALDVQAHESGTHRGMRKNHAAKALTSFYHVRLSEEPPPPASSACESLCTLVDAINRAGSPTRKNILTAMKDIELKTHSGSVSPVN